LAKTAIAIEAKDSPDITGSVVMVNVLGVRRATDRTHPALCSQNEPEILLRNPIPPLAVVGAGAAVVLNLVVAPADVMAGQAISAVASAPTRTVKREFL
jgi:hypothetical protein